MFDSKILLPSHTVSPVIISCLPVFAPVQFGIHFFFLKQVFIIAATFYCFCIAQPDIQSTYIFIVSLISQSWLEGIILVFYVMIPSPRQSVVMLIA